MGIAASLSMLLASSATLAFQTLVPSFTNGGGCRAHDVNFVFTWGLIVFLTVLCALLSFTDSFTDRDGNTHYVVATRNGFRLFTGGLDDLRLPGNELRALKNRMKMKPRDLLHAFFSSAVFMALAFCNAEVQACLVPTETWQWRKFLTILPLAVGFLASFVFVIFPSIRKGIGGGDAAAAPGGGSSPLQAIISITPVGPSTSYPSSSISSPPPEKASVKKKALGAQ